MIINCSITPWKRSNYAVMTRLWPPFFPTLPFGKMLLLCFQDWAMPESLNSTLVDFKITFYTDFDWSEHIWKNLFEDYLLQLTTSKKLNTFQQDLEINASLRKSDLKKKKEHTNNTHHLLSVTYPGKNKASLRSPGHSKINLKHSYLKTILIR